MHRRIRTLQVLALDGLMDDPCPPLDAASNSCGQMLSTEPSHTNRIVRRIWRNAKQMHFFCLRAASWQDGLSEGEEKRREVPVEDWGELHLAQFRALHSEIVFFLSDNSLPL